MNEPIKLFFCTDGIFPHAVGGMQRHSLLLISELAAYPDIDITVIHPHGGVQIFDDKLGIKELCIATDFNSGNYLKQCYGYSKEVYRLVSEHPNAIIYSQGLSIWYKSSKLSDRLIVNPHGLEPYQALSLEDKFKGTPFRLIFNTIFRNATKVVSLGGHLSKILEKRIGKEKVIVLPNAVNKITEIKRTFDNDTIKFLFVGRFAFNKGIDVLIDAVKRLNEEPTRLKMEFYLVGKGPLYGKYTKSHNLPNLHYVGFADDEQLNQLYEDCDVFILPTLFEGMPTVVLEAMTRSMAIIVTDVGATKEMVDDSNGFIIEKNNVESLINAIKTYCKLNSDQKNKLADASFKRVNENFTWDKVAKQHYDLFRSMHDSIIE